MPVAQPRSPARWAGWFAAAASLLLAVAGWWRAESLDGETARLAEAQQEMAGELEALRAELAQKERQLEVLTPPDAAQLASARAELASDPESVSWSWATTDDPTAAGATGDVVWNSKAQEGYMRFRGLAANNPGEQQYQLWIFDASRDDRFPVDGGVFDVPAGADEVIVPIRAKLPVDQPALFAVTVEQPGGVVVSSRERISVLAQPPGA
ncbi:MAG: anti-sigma factor [Gammaproteobacteria bacterium]